jgi:ABC-2 type transport system ATP-binding protein
MNKQSVPALNRYLVEQNIEVLSLQQRNSLEDYFLSVTTGNQHVEAFSN